jgi:hypothetical protein
MFDQEALEQEFDAEDEEINEALKQEEDEEESPEPEIDHKEPAPKLHISKDDWVASGRDPAKWVSPELFAETTRRINETSKLRQENQRIHARLTNVAFLQQQQIARLKADLESRRDDAIDVGDRTAVKAFDKQLRDLDTEESLIAEPKQVAQQSAIPAAVAEWNQRNEWLTADHPLKPLANDIYTQAIDDGETVKAALKLVDAELAKHRANGEQRKISTKSMVDSPSRGSVSRSDSVGLRMSDCTREERDMYNEFYKTSGATEKEFLKDLAKFREGK